MLPVNHTVLHYFIRVSDCLISPTFLKPSTSLWHINSQLIILSSSVTEKLEANYFGGLATNSVSHLHQLNPWSLPVPARVSLLLPRRVASPWALNSLSSSAHKPCSLSCLSFLLSSVSSSNSSFLSLLHVPLFLLSNLKNTSFDLTLLASNCSTSLFPFAVNLLQGVVCTHCLQFILFHFSFKFTLVRLLALWLQFNVGRKSI